MGKLKVDATPDFYVHEIEKWLVLDHKLHGFSGTGNSGE
jgi:hypothetical protein